MHDNHVPEFFYTEEFPVRAWKTCELIWRALCLVLDCRLHGANPAGAKVKKHIVVLSRVKMHSMVTKMNLKIEPTS